MSNLRLVAKNEIDHPSCILTCSVTPTLALDNLKNMVRGRIFRAPASPAFDIKGTYGGSGVYASMVSLIRTNLEPSATWRFRGYSTADWTGTPAIDTTTLVAIDSTDLGDLDFGVEPLGSGIFDPFYGQKMTLAWFARTLILSWTLTITDTGNSSGFVDASRLWLGDYYELANNPSYGAKVAWREATQQWETDGGSIRSDAGVPYRTLSLDLGYVVEADRAQLFDTFRYCGMRKDIFVCPYPSGTAAQVRDYTMNGVLQVLPDLVTVGYGQDTTTLNFREV